MSSTDETAESPINWTGVGALYAALLIGLVWMLYWGDYRNAAWLGLLGVGGGLTAYGRTLEYRGESDQGQRWQWAGGVAYAVFAVWAGLVLLRSLG